MLDWSKYSCGAAVGDTHFEKHGSLTGSKLSRAARRPTQILQSGAIGGDIGEVPLPGAFWTSG
jgi:hypothetical protein